MALAARDCTYTNYVGYTLWNSPLVLVIRDGYEAKEMRDQLY